MVEKHLPPDVLDAQSLGELKKMVRGMDLDELVNRIWIILFQANEWGIMDKELNTVITPHSIATEIACLALPQLKQRGLL